MTIEGVAGRSGARKENGFNPNKLAGGNFADSRHLQTSLPPSMKAPRGYVHASSPRRKVSVQVKRKQSLSILLGLVLHPLFVSLTAVFLELLLKHISRQVFLL